MSKAVRSFEEAAMEVALAAARRARGRTSPNPWVGAVLVPRGKEADPSSWRAGATSAPGGPHAEVVAIGGDASVARGATLVTTLEPCAHHGRTPPCTDAILRAGIARVVVGVRDPDPQVNGAGVRALEEAGVEVSEGVLANRVEEELAPYLHHRRYGTPLVVLKLAMTLDGRIADSAGRSKWITGPEARRDAHRLRYFSDAIVVGANTVRKDAPSLTARRGEKVIKEPLRVVLGDVPPTSSVSPCLSWRGALEDLLFTLGAKGVLQVLVEGGAKVAASFHEERLVDRYVFYFAPGILASARALPAFYGQRDVPLEEMARGRIVAARRLGPDLKVEFLPEGGCRLEEKAG